MLDFNGARDLVTQKYGRKWDDRDGVFYVPPEGYEDKTHFLLEFGAEEWLVDRDPAYVRVDDGLVLVRKSDSQAEVVNYLVARDKIDKMKPVAI